ncbi:MAG: glycosyltransferase [Verrucomicrobiales bacterium]|nr:glycosyltransferase [Verrucomicrobiales bacterium]
MNEYSGSRRGCLKVSLVVGTYGPREAALSRFLDSVRGLPSDGVEVIVVDQNPDERLAQVCSSPRIGVELTRMRSAPGLSRSRNLGVSAARGDVVGFPDDDCWYYEQTLGVVGATFDQRPEARVVCGRIVDEHGAPYLHDRWPSQPGWVSMPDTLLFLASAALFVRRPALIDVGGFDEAMGVGAWHGSCEELDVARRILRKGGRIWYEPGIVVGHPRAVASGLGDPMVHRRRERSYARGLGYLLGKEGAGVLMGIRLVGVPLVKALVRLLMLDLGRSCDCQQQAMGRWEGWRSGRGCTRRRLVGTGVGCDPASGTNT